MARINPALFERLKQNLGLSQPRIYALIDKKVRDTHLPPPIAAIALASERGINISKFASDEELAEIRHVSRLASPPTVVVPNATPSNTTKKKSKVKKAARADRRGTKVFVVHGRNLKARDAMFTFLRAIGLNPLEWSQVIKLTGEPSPYVGTILETAFREAAAIVVLFTPDDEAKLRSEFLKSTDPRHEKRLTGQARANVLFEAGMAFGRDTNSTVLVQIGEIRPFSDVAGRHILRLSNAAAKRNELATRLANAGCNVDTSGDDWLTAGDFS